MKSKPSMARGMTQFAIHLERYAQATKALTDAVARQNAALSQMLETTNRIVRTVGDMENNRVMRPCSAKELKH